MMNFTYKLCNWGLGACGVDMSNAPDTVSEAYVQIQKNEDEWQERHALRCRRQRERLEYIQQNYRAVKGDHNGRLLSDDIKDLFR